MYELSVTTSFDAAHCLRNYPDKCGRLHGHTWTVTVTICGRELDASGMLLDFGVLKKIAQEAVQDFDHNNLNELPVFTKRNPTAENIAREVFMRMKDRLAALSPSLAVTAVQVWESPQSSARYTEEPGK
ncbi:MAG: 6-carboxytetrahydropterin synthase QueD [Desulfotomaculales bacterium]